MAAWMTTKVCDAMTIPTVAGVYALYTRDMTLIYIGSSSNLRSRVRSHVRSRSTPDLRFKWGRIRYHTAIIKWRTAKKLGEHLSAEYRLLSRVTTAENHRAKEVV